MKKLEKYLLMVPLLAVMLLNCVCYGQVISSAASTFDYTFNEAYRERMHHYDELNVDFDFSDADAMIENYIASSGVGVTEYYIYFLYVNTNNYHNSSAFEIYLEFFFVRDGLDSIVYNENVIYFSSYDYHCTFNYNKSTSVLSNLDFTNSSFTNASDRVTSYCPSTGFHYNVHSGLFGDSNKYNVFTKDYCYLYQGSNIPDFPLPYEQVDNNLLDVNVSFSPDLNGEISRTVKVNGSTTTLETFNMTVINNSKFNIQYLMAIYPSNEYFRPFNDEPGIANSWASSTPNGKTYIGNPVYVYVKDEWIYLPHGEQGTITGYAPSSWHYLSSGATDDVTINFNQLKLDSTIIYEVSVYAVRNDFNYVSPYIEAASLQWSSDYCLDSSLCQCVYDSVFRLLNPAEFNPNNNEDSYAFDADDSLLFNRANGYIDSNGEVVIDRFDTNQWISSGSDDPWVNWDSDNNAWEVYNKNQNTVSSDINQLSTNFSSFFKFVNKTFSYFPKNFQTIITLGLTSVVVIAILKVVF